MGGYCCHGFLEPVSFTSGLALILPIIKMLFSEHLLLSTPAASELALTADDVHRFQWVEKELTAFWEMQRGEVLGRHTTD